MTQVEKDLCARLPYGVKVSVNGGEEPWTLKGMFEGEHTGMMLILEPSFSSKDVSPQTSNWQLSQCKPYLRPMSSMTEEEEEYISQTFDATPWGTIVTYEIGINDPPEIGVDRMQNFIDWLLKNHFDFMGLIPKGLAIEVTKDNNPYKD